MGGAGAAALLLGLAAAAMPAAVTASAGARALLWAGGGGGGGGGFFGNPTNGNDNNAAFSQFGGGMRNSAFYGGRNGPVGAFGSSGNIACGTIGLAYENVPCTGARNTSPQLNAYGLGGQTAPGGVLPGVTDSIPLGGSAGAQPFGGSPFGNGGAGAAPFLGAPSVGGVFGGGGPYGYGGGIYGGGSVYGPNAGLVRVPSVGALVGRRLLGAVRAAAEARW